jgi:hypothetical protein
VNRRLSALALSALGTGLILNAGFEERERPAPVDEQAVDRYLTELSLASANGHPAQREVSSLGAKLEGAKPAVDSALTSMH